jgi:hypothetical protein
MPRTTCGMKILLKTKRVVPKLALTRAEAAEALGITPVTIDRLAKRGLLRPSRATRRPLYSIEEMERFLRDTSANIALKKEVF